jgi:2-dehydro-3-deoxygluconokinase
MCAPEPPRPSRRRPYERGERVSSGAPDVIGLGETMLSFVARDGAIDTATEFLATHGGAETNTLVAMVGLDHTSAWVSRLGDDPAGLRIRSALGDAGVDLRWVSTDPERQTGLMVRDTVGNVRYWRTGSAASAIDPSALDDVPVAEARAVLVTGITAMLGPGPHATAITFLERARGLRAVDPNLRPGLWGSDRPRDLVLPLVERCDVLLAGERELTTLVGGAGEEAARRCAALGVREVVVKRGVDGAAVLDRDGAWSEIRPPAGAEIDAVGAGDAFNAAYLAARLADAACIDAVHVGCDAGAAAARSFGDVAPPTARLDVDG